MWLTAAAHVVLTVALVWRLAAYRAEVRRDLADPVRGCNFLTFVAGTDVLGARLALAGRHVAAAALLVVGALAWLVLGYLIPWALALGDADEPLVNGANGAWFVWVVASQSVAVLAATVEPAFAAARPELALLAVSCWSIGVFCYAAVGVLVAVRLLLRRVRPGDLNPSYWVAMGATAITVLAGARVDEMAAAPAVAATRGLIAGASVMFWAFGSWLVPALLAAGWWRHVTNRVPLRYEPGWWAIVFPLGMYGVATRSLGEVDHLPIVESVGRAEIWVALAMWAAVFAAILARFAVLARARVVR